MFHTRNSSQNTAEFVLLDQLVEEDHLLRKIDKHIDFSFIIEKVKPYYSENKPEGFFYLDHRTTDMKYNIITDTYVTPGNVHDSVPYLDRLDHQIARFGFQVEAVALDSGYLTTPICKGLSDPHIFGVIAHRRYHPARGLFPKWKFHYDSEQDRYIFQNQQTLTYSTTVRKGYPSYKSNPEIYSFCPLLENCTKLKNWQKVITRHVWEDHKEKVRQNRLSVSGKNLLLKKWLRRRKKC